MHSMIITSQIMVQIDRE